MKPTMYYYYYKTYYLFIDIVLSRTSCYLFVSFLTIRLYTKAFICPYASMVLSYSLYLF